MKFVNPKRMANNTAIKSNVFLIQQKPPRVLLTLAGLKDNHRVFYQKF